MRENIDLNPLLKQIEPIVRKFFNSKKTIGIGIALTFPPDYKNCSWVTNFEREDGALLFLRVA